MAGGIDTRTEAKPLLRAIPAQMGTRSRGCTRAISFLDLLRQRTRPQLIPYLLVEGSDRVRRIGDIRVRASGVRQRTLSVSRLWRRSQVFIWKRSARAVGACPRWRRTPDSSNG